MDQERQPHRLLLIDLSAVFWWKWHAAAGQPVDTAYEVTIGKVRQLAAGFSHVAVCCDTGRSFRYEIEPRYKSKRPPRDDAALEQLVRVRDDLRAAGFVLLEESGFEGDDIIATAVSWAGRQDPPVEVVIAGQDKDLLALLGPCVSMLHIQSGNLIRPADVQKKFGVRPDQMRDFLSLVGDTSDSIEGVPKIGPENAKRLLAEFGSVTGIYQALDQKKEDGSWKVTPESIRESLLKNLGTLDKALSLVTLRTDAPIEAALVLEQLASPVASGAASAVASGAAPDKPADKPRPAKPAEKSSPSPDAERPRPAASPARAADPIHERLRDLPRPSSSAPARADADAPIPDEDLAAALGLVRRAMCFLSCSGRLDQLGAALAAAQGAMKHADKDSKNPHFSSRYADLASVIDACRAPLAANGLSVVQLPAITDRGHVLRTRLLHASGQWIESEIPVLTTRGGPQEYGSALTYARRYALAAMVGVAPDDDDGEAAEGRGSDARRQAQRRA